MGTRRKGDAVCFHSGQIPHMYFAIELIATIYKVPPFTNVLESRLLYVSRLIPIILTIIHTVDVTFYFTGKVMKTK